MAGLDAELDAALKAMESSFHVRLIGTFGPDLVWAPAEVEAEAWLAGNHLDFDQFPVKHGDGTVGILLRAGDHLGKTVGEAMQPLREGLIVSADMPIADLIPQLRESHYRLVLRGACMDGLVTQSDLLKLPVRLVAFALISHLEQVMARVIVEKWPGNNWLSHLTEGRQEKIRAKLAGLQRKNLDPPVLELTEFCDKRDLCKKLLQDGNLRFCEELRDLELLRNQLAHAATFIDPSNGQLAVTTFVDQYESANYWIRELTTLATRIKAEK